ncbi:hypothetical protein vseg_004059 [Gypsophila vaccaria]
MVFMMERNNKGGNCSTNGHVGLRIVQQIFEGESSNNYNNNVVVKYGLSSLTRTHIISSSSLSLSLSSSRNVISDSTSGVVDGDSCYLKSCHLCKRPLQFDKDIYMYRGDQGFCSKECRNKQIIMDERKEMEAKYSSFKRSVAISSQIDCRGCETCKLLQELRQRNRRHPKQPPPPPPSRPILSIS